MANMFDSHNFSTSSISWWRFELSDWKKCKLFVEPGINTQFRAFINGIFISMVRHIFSNETHTIWQIVIRPKEKTSSKLSFIISVNVYSNKCCVCTMVIWQRETVCVPVCVCTANEWMSLRGRVWVYELCVRVYECDTAFKFVGNTQCDQIESTLFGERVSTESECQWCKCNKILSIKMKCLKKIESKRANV